MLKKFAAIFVSATLAVLALTSCGGETASGTGDFATVRGTAAPPAERFESDVLQWTATPCQSQASIRSDDVTYTITSTAYTSANTGQTTPIAPSPLKVSKITVSYIPVNPTTTPALPVQVNPAFSSAGQIIQPNTTQNIPVTIASLALKQFLTSGLGSQSINCSNVVEYTYYVNVSFELLEVNTNRVATVTANGFQVTFADFPDSGSTGSGG